MVFRILSIIFSFLTVVLTAVMFFTFRKHRRITFVSSLFSLLICLILPVIYLAITGNHPDLRLALPFFSLGLLLGYLRGLVIKLEFVGDQVVGRHSRLFLLLWGFSLALNQFLSTLDSIILLAMGLISLWVSTGIQVGFYGILAARRLVLIPEEFDTGRIRNAGSQRLVALSFGGLLLVFMIESLLLSYPVLPLSGKSISTSGEASIPVIQEMEPMVEDEIPTMTETPTPKPYFSGEQILVWTRPLAAFMTESEHKLYAFNADGSGVTQVYDQTVSALDSPAPQLSSDGSFWVVNSKRSGEFEHYLLAVDGSRTIPLWYRDRPVIVEDWSPDGSKILVVSETSSGGDILITDREGENWQQVAATEADETSPRWSPNGEYILYQTDQDRNQEIYLVDSLGGNSVNLSQHPAEDKRASWVQEGSKIIFTSDRDGIFGLYLMNRDGSDIQRIAQDSTCGFRYILSPDDEHIFYTSDSFYSVEIWEEEQTECNKSTGILASLSSGYSTTLNISVGDPKWSPDGGMLLFHGLDSKGTDSIKLFVIEADGTNLADLTPPGNEMFMAIWSSDSSRVAQVESYFIEGEGGRYVLTVTNPDGSGRIELAPVPWDPDYAFAYKGFSWP